METAKPYIYHLSTPCDPCHQTLSHHFSIETGYVTHKMKFSQVSAILALVGNSVLAHPAWDDLMEPTAPLKRAQAALSQVTGFGPNSSNAKMFIYVPNKLAAKPAVVVAIHYCTGTAQAYYGGSPYAQLADQKGFIVIYPESPYSGTCWDVSSRQTLTHNGGGNSNSIANMVNYTLNKYSGDASKVFVTGTSSGGMMTVSSGPVCSWSGVSTDSP